VTFAEKALQPAKVSKVTVVDAGEKHLEVVVDDSQLSLAIGKKGQNVRLAAKLLGWKIDIKSEEEKRQEVELQMSALVTQTSTPLSSVPGLGEGLVEKLNAAGVTTVESLADMTPEQLEAIEGIGPKTVEKISLAVNNYFASLEGVAVEGEVAAESEAAPAAEAEAVERPVAIAEEAATEGTIEADVLEGAAAEAASDDTAEVQAAGEEKAAVPDEQASQSEPAPGSASEGQES
jgi:transcription termination/antitermination protein NusA